MKQTTQIGATVEEAISLALQKLGHSREQVDVEVLQEGKKGFLGFGTRKAEVRVTVKEIVQQVNEQPFEQSVPAMEALVVEAVFVDEPILTNEDQPIHQEQLTQVDPIEEAKLYLTSIALEMGITDLVIDHTTDGKNVAFKLSSEKAALLIGKRGYTLNALQQLTQLMLNKTAKSFMILQMDVEDYRERRQIALEQLAARMADKAIRTRKTVTFEPMASYERKIIHNALANRLDIETYSEGIEPNRYLVIEPVR
ncbi:protein jag [Lysinibacillus sp. 2017]|uniref:RNA-binding cell elongation regulator Jag/EloR n=1 Tax=unclassified Lysinibacillus TaxID=2636778 RepID=UPI000D526E0A|nr:MULTISPECIES: RNA-binding cell elongation regulator Jag/EloR [unclassified Lysinibacillus]AWE09183.1 protein jag [Lysinibacillus sp. 2017]TGN36009.1 protein jag [Lysinibacillus sp. S2017]